MASPEELGGRVSKEELPERGEGEVVRDLSRGYVKSTQIDKERANSVVEL